MSPADPPVDEDTASVGRGYQAGEHLGSLKPPIYETSVFVLESAEAGKRLFESTYGLGEITPDEEPGYIYSRVGNPNLGVAEARMAAWESTDDALVFNSGMAAITTVFLTHLRPGNVVLHSTPLYGGTTGLLNGLMTELGVEARPFSAKTTEEELRRVAEEGPVAMVFVETPANPTNDIFDIAMTARVAAESGARLVVDNTFLSPVWQKPIDHGAHLVVHSATKYLGGHNDLTAGVVCGPSGEIEPLRHMRYRLGTTASPSTAWMLTRSLETLRIRVERQTATAIEIAAFLRDHSKVVSVNHLSLLTKEDPRFEIYQRQCLGPGAMISFEIAGGEEEAFRFLDALQVIRMAVSLGGTESLASHPWSMSPPTATPEQKQAVGITPRLIRLSVGVEAPEDLTADLDQALSHS